MSVTRESVFFIGLGGMGMAPLALYLAGEGRRVLGHDDHWREPARGLLEKRGIGTGEFQQLPAEVSCVVYSSAIGSGHPLLREARERGLRTLRRGEMLAEAVRGHKLIAVVGSHGKTTTTALLIHALRAAGHDVGYLLGAMFADPETPPARHSATPWVAAEIDESDGTIDGFSPEITVAVNFDWDHADRYRSEAELEAAFTHLFKRTRSLVLIPQGCAKLRRLAQASGTPFRSFGPGGDFAARVKDDDGTSQHLAINGVFSPRDIVLPLGGEFNAVNASAALAAAQAAFTGLAEQPFEGYKGVRRRQDVLLKQPGLTIYADYAHHPTEITALLRSLRARHTGRLVVVFQPHRYTRTRQFALDFARTLSEADRILLLPVYAASEAFISEGTTDVILEAASVETRKRFTLHETFASASDALAEILTTASGETAVAFIGAGDIDEFAAAYTRGLSGSDSDPSVFVIKNNNHLDWFDVLRPRVGSETLLRRNEPLAEKTTLGVGGAALFYAEPANAADLALLLGAARVAHTPVFCLGRGSNVIVADSGFKGLVVHLAHANWSELRLEEGGAIWAGAGARLKELCGFAAKHGMAGMEFLEGIPGSVGGSLRMNAGAMGGWIFDVVAQVEYVTLDGETHRANRGEFHAEYRQCRELLTAVATGALFHGPSLCGPEEIRKRMKEFAAKRKASQPRERSAGCLFKNPLDGHAGKLIDQMGLKGRSVGGIEVSGIHANFIINRGGGTATEALELARQVRQEVRTRCGVTLEPEVLLLGAEWEDVLK